MNKILRKKGSLILFFAILLVLVGSFSLAFAQPVSPCPPGQLCNPLKYNDLYCFFKDIVGIASQIGFVVVVFFVIYSGFLFVTARGNEEQLKTAKNAFVGTMIGAAVVLGAWIFSEGVANTIGKIMKTTPPTHTCP